MNLKESLLKPDTITQIAAHSPCCSMTQSTKIGLKCLSQTLVGNLSFLYHFYFLIQLSNHSSFSSFAERAIVRKGNIPKKINAPMIFSYRNLTWMQFKVQIATKKILYFGYQFIQKILTFRHNYKIVCVANIIFYFQFFLHKLIKFIHVDIGKKLRGQIANRESFSSKKIRRLTSEALNYFFHKPQCIRVFYFSTQKLDQNGVINTIEELSHITFQRISSLGEVFRITTKQFFQNLNTFVSAFTNATGEGMRYKGRFKNWIEDLKNCVVKYSISNSSFMYMPKLRIVNIKVAIRPVFVASIF